ncbi:hypothetical protein GQ457_16G023020 [Hibiscus cannabinus]
MGRPNSYQTDEEKETEKKWEISKKRNSYVLCFMLAKEHHSKKKKRSDGCLSGVKDKSLKKQGIQRLIDLYCMNMSKKQV